MVQRTVIHRATMPRLRPTVRAVVHCPENAFPLTFLALAFGLLAGVALAGVVIPAVVQTVVPIVVRIATGA